MEIQDRPAFPEQIETARLLLRAPREGDGAEVNAAIRETYADLNEWMEWASYLPEVEETEHRRRVARARFLAGEDFNIQAHLKTTGAWRYAPDCIRATGSSEVRDRLLVPCGLSGKRLCHRDGLYADAPCL